MAMLSWLSPVFGKKPGVAGFDYLNLTDEQRKALEGNIANMPRIEELGNLFQQFYLDQMDTAFGGTGMFRNIMAAGGRTTQEMLDQSEQMLHGEVPKDVQAAVARSSAYQSLMGGTIGGSMAGANAARNLGLTSLAMINQGAGLQAQAGNAAQRWASLSGSGAMANMLITPAQQTDLDLKQAMIKHDIKQQKLNIAAQRDPVIGGLSDIVETLTAAYVGSLGGGMGGSKGNINNAPKDTMGGTGASFGYQQNAPAWTTDASGNIIDTGGFASDGGAGSSWNPTAGLSKDSGPAVNMNEDLPTGGASSFDAVSTFNPAASGYMGAGGSVGGPVGSGMGMQQFINMINQAQFNQNPAAMPATNTNWYPTTGQW